MNDFFYYSGIVIWCLTLISIALRIVYGRKWLVKVGIKGFVGPNLVNSLNQLYTEFPDKIKRETLAKVTVGVFYRFTRIGIVALIITGLPIWLLIQQNSLIKSQNDLFLYQNLRVDKQTQLIESQDQRLKKQNDLLETQNKLSTKQTELFTDQNVKLDVQNQRLALQNARTIQQNKLIEASRRSSLVFLFNNIMDAIDKELNDPVDSTLRVKWDGGEGLLSRHLVGRIVALSRRLRPYQFYQYESDNLSSLTSPERGQLLINLLEADIDTTSLKRIFMRGTFEYADLSGYKYPAPYLKYIDLNHANLTDVEFIKGNLENAVLYKVTANNLNLSGAILDNIDLGWSTLDNANLSNTSINVGQFLSADLNDANLSGSHIQLVDFAGASLFNTDFDDASFYACGFSETEFGYTSFNNSKFKETVFIKASLDSIPSLDGLIEYLDSKNVIGTENWRVSHKLDTVQIRESKEGNFLYGEISNN